MLAAGCTICATARPPSPCPLLWTCGVVQDMLGHCSIVLTADTYTSVPSRCGPGQGSPRRATRPACRTAGRWHRPIGDERRQTSQTLVEVRRDDSGVEVVRRAQRDRVRRPVRGAARDQQDSHHGSVSRLLRRWHGAGAALSLSRPTAANPSDAHSGGPVLVDSNDRSRPARAAAAVLGQDQDQTSVAGQETTAPHRLPDRAAMIDPFGNVLGLMYNPQYVDLLVSRGVSRGGGHRGAGLRGR